MEFTTQKFVNQQDDQELLNVSEEAEWFKNQPDTHQRMSCFPAEYKTWLTKEIADLRERKYRLNNLMPQEQQRPMREIFQTHIQGNIDDLVKRLKILTLPQHVKDGNEVNILAIKKIPITDYYQGKLRRMGAVLAGICPVHKESTGSFRIYPATNTWYCFGCQAGGDIIDLVQKINNCEFGEAIKILKR